MTARQELQNEVAGSCLCKNVSFVLRGSVSEFYSCFCARCRKETGSAFAVNLFLPINAVTWVSGQDRVSRFELPDAEHFCLDFCTTCGSTVPYLSRNRRFYIVPAGTLDGDPKVWPTHSIHWADRASWVNEVVSRLSRD